MSNRRNPLIRAAVGVLAIAGLSANVGASRLGNPGDCLVNDGQFTSAGGGCQDLTTGRVWSSEMPGIGTNAYAKDYCSNLVEGGQSDWRLPTRDELIALDRDGGGTHMNWYFQPPNYARWFWSSTASKGFYIVEVDADTTRTGISTASKTSAYSAVCVR